MENPRQFASLDASDAALHGSLTNRPASAVAAGDPIDFEAISARVRYERTLPTYQYKESPAEVALRLERQAAAEQRIRAETAATNERNKLQLDREQSQRNQLRNRISTGEPVDVEVSQPQRDSPLTQIQRSTPERQPLPSTGSPPPTPSGTAARASALVEPTATPAPAALKEAIAPVAAGGLLASLPRSLPQAAGRLALPGVIGGIDFANRVVHGQPIAQAATGAVAGQIGAGIGFVLGTATGIPFMGYVGAAIGGIAGSAISDYFFHSPPSTGSPPAEIPNYPPFRGGQQPLISYIFTGTFDIYLNDVLIYTRILQSRVYGPIENIEFEDALVDNTGFIGFKIAARNSNGERNIFFPQVGHPAGGIGKNPREITTRREDGAPEIYPDLTQPAPPPDNLPHRYDASPAGNDNTVPSGTPSAGTNKGVTRNVAPSMPSNNTPNGAPFFPGHGGLAPSYLPNPTYQPSNLGGMLPQMQPLPQRQSLPFAEPEDIPVPRLAPRNSVTVTPSEGGLVPIGYAEITAGTVTQSTITVSEGTDALGNDVSTRDRSTFFTAVPSPVPTTAQPIPMSDALSPVPKVKTAAIVKSPTELSNDGIKTALDQQQKEFNEKLGQLTAIATAIAAITPAIQGLPDAIANSPNVRAANKETTQGAVCEIAQPGGCLGNALDDSANKVNQNNNQNTANLLDKINAGANAAQLALLELINTKLGDLLPGGLSATFTRLWQTMQVDRVISILTLITTFHNGLMLSNNLGQTLFSAIDNISQAAGFKWKNEKGEESGFSSIVSEWTANFFKSIFGEENYTELVAEYKKANRIYQATANIFNALQSIGYSILSALEVVGSYVALIGNALRKWGEVGESAYKWFNPQPNFHNKFFTTIEGVTNVVSQVDQVASEVVSIEQNVAQIGELKNELGKSIGEEEGSKQGAQPPEAAKVKAGFDASKLVSATGIAISDSDKEADE